MQNYFNYFTEIEERFQQRRGSLLMLSTLDWALIETWREAGVPLEAVLRGIDNAFDKHDAKSLRSPRKVRRGQWSRVVRAERNGGGGTGHGSLNRCGASRRKRLRRKRFRDGTSCAISGAERRHSSKPQSSIPPQMLQLQRSLLVLRALSIGMRSQPLNHSKNSIAPSPSWKKRSFAALHHFAPEDELVSLREQAARELAPYRGKMQAVQIKQVQQQFLQKKLLEARKLPRLSLFYMSHG